MHVSRSFRILVAVLATTAASAPPLAHAETSGYQETAVGGDAKLIFKDDVMTAGGLDGTMSVVKAPTRALRSGLLRPRVEFVAELTKTVENL
jgi:hypothetical protein